MMTCRSDFARHMQHVARRLLGEPNKALSSKRELRWGRHGSLAVRIEDGTWYDHQAGEGGGVLNLIARETGNQAGEAVAWLRSELKIDLDEAPPAAPRARPRPEPLRWSPRAESLWRACRPLAGTVGAAYLNHRGCALPSSDEVRFHAGLDHWPTRTVWPALVSRVTDFATCEALSLHMTFIAADGSGKAPIEKPKLLLPGHQKAGGVIRLVDDVGITLGLGLGEGLETTLAVTAAGWSPVWASIDAGNLAGLPVLAGIETLTIFTDHDEAGTKAAQTLAARWRSARHEVRVCTPPGQGQDWNDCLHEAAR